MSSISNDCGFNFHYNGSTCVTCPNGFYGRDCADQCATGLYGFLCHKLCRCPVDRCHHVYGCFSGIKDTSTLIVTRGDVLTSGSNNFEVPVPIPVNNARVSTGSYNTGTSVPNSSCTSPNKQRQILIVSIGGMNILLLLLIGIYSLLYFYEKRQSFRNRLSFKIKSKHQDDQSRVNLVSISNNTPVETIYFIENPENGHHSEENSDFALAFADRHLRNYVQCQETNET
ncbi:uncharacterized protein LOC144623067 isoform X2 [Crassostrea virginica]